MRQRDTLRGAGRTRGVHDTAKVFRSRGDGIHGVLFTQLPQLLETHDVQVVILGLETVQVFLLGLLVGVVDDVLDGLDILQNVGHGGDENGIAEDGGTGCLDQRVLQSLLTQGIICGDNGQGLRGGTCSQGLRLVVDQ